jgi:hypothetical protein
LKANGKLLCLTGGAERIDREMTAWCPGRVTHAQNVVTFPRYNPEQTDATAFTFTTRGIWFDVVVGDSLPAYMYQHCCVSSPDKPIFVGDFDRFVMDEIMQSNQTARVCKILQPA